MTQSLREDGEDDRLEVFTGSLLGRVSYDVVDVMGRMLKGYDGKEGVEDGEWEGGDEESNDSVDEERIRRSMKEWKAKREWPMTPVEELNRFGRVLGRETVRDALTVDVGGQDDVFKGLQKTNRIPKWKAPTALHMAPGSELARGIFGGKDPREAEHEVKTEGVPPVSSRRPEHSMWDVGMTHGEAHGAMRMVVGRGEVRGSRRGEFSKKTRANPLLLHAADPVNVLTKGRLPWRASGSSLSSDKVTAIERQKRKRRKDAAYHIPGLTNIETRQITDDKETRIRLGTVAVATRTELASKAMREKQKVHEVFGCSSALDYCALFRKKARAVGIPGSIVNAHLSKTCSKAGVRLPQILFPSIASPKKSITLSSHPKTPSSPIRTINPSLAGFDPELALREAGAGQSLRAVAGHRLAKALPPRSSGLLESSHDGVLPPWLSEKVERYENSLGRSGTRLDLEAAWESAKIDPSVRAESNVEAIALFVRACPFSEGLDVTSVLDIARGTTTKEFGTGEAIINEGDIAHEFFILVQGRCVVTVEALGVVAQVAPGESFGERGLIAASRRSATVRAVQPSRLLAISRATFSRAIQALHQRRHVAVTRSVAINPILGTWEAGLLSKFASCGQVLDLPAGGVLQRQGAPMLHIFVIMRGSVAIRHTVDMERRNRWPTSDPNRAGGYRTAHLCATETIGEMRDGALYGLAGLLDAPLDIVPTAPLTLQCATTTRLLKVDALAAADTGREVPDAALLRSRDERQHRLRRLARLTTTHLVLQASQDGAGHPPKAPPTQSSPTHPPQSPLARLRPLTKKSTDISPRDGLLEHHTYSVQDALKRSNELAAKLPKKLAPDDTTAATTGIFLYPTAGVLGKGPGDEDDAAALQRLRGKALQEATELRRQAILSMQPLTPPECDVVLRRVLLRAAALRTHKALSSDSIS